MSKIGIYPGSFVYLLQDDWSPLSSEPGRGENKNGYSRN